MFHRSSLMRVFQTIRRVSSTQNELVETIKTPTSLKVPPSELLYEDDDFSLPFETKSVLAPCDDEDLSTIAPHLKPTFNFAAYVNKSDTLQQLVKLGVNLNNVEKKKGDVSFLLKLDFEKDIKNYILFLSDLGVSNDEIAIILSENPFILKEGLDTLEVRVNYLKSKLFTDSMITRIISRNVYWLMFSIPRIDERLGFFQKEFSLSGYEVRNVTTKQPKLITYSLKHIRENIFVIKEEMGFLSHEIKSIFLSKPNIFMKSSKHMLKTFEYVHQTMKIPLERIAEFPQILTCREFRVKQRHLFLETLGKVQYNKKEPNYISLNALISGTDAQFCDTVAKSSIQAFNAFLKSL